MSDLSKEYLRERIAKALDAFELDELLALLRMVLAIERRRGILQRLDRRRDRTRRSAINAGLRELRNAKSTSRPVPELVVLDGGEV